MTEKESQTGNRRLAKVAVQCYADTFVVKEKFSSPHQHLW